MVYRRGLKKYAIYLRKGVLLDRSYAGFGNRDLRLTSIRIEPQHISEAIRIEPNDINKLIVEKPSNQVIERGG